VPDAGSEAGLEQETVALFADLGWETANAFYEAFTPEEATAKRPYLGRGDESQVLLRPRLRGALERLNPHLPSQAIEAAVTELSRGRSMMTKVRANQEVYHLLKDGIPVHFRDAEGRDRFARAQVIDWNDPPNNDFLLAQQLWIQGQNDRKRADLVGFVNGIPLLFGELKAPFRELENAYRYNLCDYKQSIPHLFHYTGFIVLSNGSEAVLGNLSAPFRHFGPWKKVADENEEGAISLERLVRGTCTPARLLDIVENYTLYHEGSDGLEKITAKNHQYLGVENVIQRLDDPEERRKLGVFWHTQGSGKSFSMIFFSQKVLRKLGGNYTFVIVTDRTDLDDQIYKNFSRSGVVTEGESQVRARSGEHLKRLLREDHRFVFTLIHKFHTRNVDDLYPVLSERDDVIVMTDEAHRTQYGTLAMNMRRALPKAAFIGFTGTPLMEDEEELTWEVFGEYVSVYDFSESMEDEATVPLYYENHSPEMELTDDEFAPKMERILEQADVDPAAEEALQQRFVREYEVITRDNRLETIAEDLVDHFIHRGYRGKALMVSIDRLTAVKMYEKVQAHWQDALEELREQVADARPEERAEIEELLAYAEETDMAVVISQGHHDVQFFRKHGLDIRPHHERMKNEELDEKFKDPDDPFRLAFVCAKWRTGFDAPACSTIYLDRPMRNHTLMQTIARANRVFGEKNNGLIIDYINVFRELREALAIYATGRGAEIGEYPVKDKDALVEQLRGAIAEAEAFCDERGVDLDAILDATSAFEHVTIVQQATGALVDARAEEAVGDAVERIIVNDELKLRFLNVVAEVDRLFKAILPDPQAAEFRPRHDLLEYLADRVRQLTPAVHAPDVQREVTELLDEAIKARPYVIREDTPVYDPSQVDYEALRERFASGRRRTEAERLRKTISIKLRRMIRRNRTRVDYQQEFQRLIDAYNAGSLNVRALFEQLVNLAQRLEEEEKRHIRENLTEEELALFDILTRPGPDLKEDEERQVKEIARDLLTKLKDELLALDWQKRQRYRAGVRLAIGEMLYDRLPEPYSAELCDQKRDDVYSHVYRNYAGAGESVYGEVA
jgi:type I restriction enzyme R subunit